MAVRAGVSQSTTQIRIRRVTQVAMYFKQFTFLFFRRFGVIMISARFFLVVKLFTAHWVNLLFSSDGGSLGNVMKPFCRSRQRFSRTRLGKGRVIFGEVVVHLEIVITQPVGYDPINERLSNAANVRGFRNLAGYMVRYNGSSRSSRQPSCLV